MQKKTEIAAVICELNPLHFGHRALFRQVLAESAGLVCILSGNFVQRGEPAVLDKWARTRLALENGADLVLELPLPWACAGAERFAEGGVCIARALGSVNTLAFGSEIADEALLNRAAQGLLSPAFSQYFRELPEEGETFARRREKALARLLGPEVLPVLRSPNATLGVEYCKALYRAGGGIAPKAFLRQGAGHDAAAQSGEFCSAARLREGILAGEDLQGLAPESTLAMLAEQRARGRCPAELLRLERAILCKLRMLEPEDFALLPDVSEGLENRLAQAVRRAGSLEELYSLVKSKRYTHARVRRLVLHAFLGVTGDLPKEPPYLRVLGRSSRGEELLRAARPQLPLVSRAADAEKLGEEARRVFRLEARADDLYALAQPSPAPCGRDYTEKLICLP